MLRDGCLGSETAVQENIRRSREKGIRRSVLYFAAQKYGRLQPKDRHPLKLDAAEIELRDTYCVFLELAWNY